jgi:hypothetical protein
MTSPAQSGTDQAIVPGTDHTTPPAFSVNPAGVIRAGDPPPPAPAMAQHPATEPVPAAAPPAADPGPSPRARWNEIQAMFVDDPRSSVELAAGLVDASAEALIASIRQRQRSLPAAWHGDDAGTEELRIALQQYRIYWDHLEDFSREP